MIAGDPRLLDLLTEALDSGRTPEEVCAHCPELVQEVRRRVQRCGVVQRELMALLPSDDEEWPRPAASGPPSAPAALPRIPGYEVVEILGHGGVGVVYRARHLALGREVALKMLLSGEYAGRDERIRFKREAEAVAGLAHPHIVRVYDVGEWDGRPFFTMELVEGGTLAQRLGGAAWAAAPACALVATLAGAVQSAHAGGVIHRDLKPGNILMRKDGSPAVADFGLARMVRPEAPLTASGAPVGTPDYMAPEQAAGRSGAIGPAADVYALGAILYELLTGRPPFRGGTAAEIQRRVIDEEPVPPRRLNAKVPRDLGTIVLKCLEKQPRRRYASAAELAEDLGRFRRGEPIAARPTGAAERVAKWARRRPAAAALWVGGVAAAMALGAAALSRAADRAATERAVADDLRAAGELRRQSRWAEADTAVERADMRLAGGGGDLRRRLELARADGDVVRRLDGIRTLRVTRANGAEAVRAYADLFRDLGLGDERTDPAAVAARVRASDLRPALVAALYDWVRCTGEGRRYEWLLAVLRDADPDPSGWRDRALDPRNSRDRDALSAAAAEAAPESRTVEQLLALYDRLRNAGGDSVHYLLHVRRAHPGDFWTHLELSRVLREAGNAADAVRYGQAAVALRPKAGVAHAYLAEALAAAGRGDEAIDNFREATALDPGTVSWRSRLGQLLSAAGRHGEAIPELEAGLAGGTDRIADRARLGAALEAVGRIDDAAEHYEQTIQGFERHVSLPVFSITPESRRAYEQARARLRALPRMRGRAHEMRARLRADFYAPGRPAEERVRSGYAEYQLFAGDVGEYRRACRSLLDQAESSVNPRVWEVVGRTALLRQPEEESDLRRATALVDRAAKTQRRWPLWHPYASAAKALAEYRNGRHEAAVSIVKSDAAGVLGPVPALVAAMAQARLGRPDDARRELARAALAYDWKPICADGPDAWMCHVLRREAESLVIPDSADVLGGRRQPADVVEWLATAGACQYSELHATHAGLWEAALAADPSLAGPGGRGRAVAAAALAGCGVGAEAAALDEAARAYWRGRAREWVGAELAAATAPTTEPAGGAARAGSRATLQALSASQDLAGLRDGDGLAKLPDAERAEWIDLWRRVSIIAGGTE